MPTTTPITILLFLALNPWSTLLASAVAEGVKVTVVYLSDMMVTPLMTDVIVVIAGAEVILDCDEVRELEVLEVLDELDELVSVDELVILEELGSEDELSNELVELSIEDSEKLLELNAVEDSLAELFEVATASEAFEGINDVETTDIDVNDADELAEEKKSEEDEKTDDDSDGLSVVLAVEFDKLEMSPSLGSRAC